MDCSPPGSSVHRILQMKILEWVFPPLGDLPEPRIEPTSLASPALAGRLFTTVPPTKPHVGGNTCPLYADTVTGQQVWKCQKETEHTTACFVAEHFEAAVSPGTTSPNVPISSRPCGAHRRVPTKERSAAPPGPDPSLSLT